MKYESNRGIVFPACEILISKHTPHGLLEGTKTDMEKQYSAIPAFPKYFSLGAPGYLAHAFLVLIYITLYLLSGSNL